MKAKRTPAYSVLSRFYDQFFAPHRKVFRRSREQALGQMLPRIRSACDLCCGTGATAIELSGPERVVFAVDASADMCRIARQKARRQGASVRVIRADMRTFRLPEPVDLITCEFDAINHLPKPSDLQRVTGAVSRALRPGGFFFFDVNTQRALREMWPRCWFAETPRAVLVSHGGYHARRNAAWSNLEWFLPAAGAWQRFTECYREVCWRDAEIRRSLRRAGFAHVQLWDGCELAPGIAWLARGLRSFYLAQKALRQRG